MPVTLNRLATAFFVFLRATDFGIRGKKVTADRTASKPFLLHPIQDVEIRADHHSDDNRQDKQTNHRPRGGQNDQPTDQFIFRFARLHGFLPTPLTDTPEAKTPADHTL